MSLVLDPRQVEWIGVRFLDPSTKTFLHEGTYYKAVRPEAEEFIQTLVKGGVLDELAQADLLAPVRASDVEMPGYPLVLEQETEFFQVAHDKWCPPMVKDAALAFIDINLRLLKRGMGLLDGHRANFIVQGNCIPKWCDIGSIVTLDRARGGELVEFLRHFVYPLLLRARSPHFDRLFRHGFVHGLSHEEAKLLLGNDIQLQGSRADVLNWLRELVQGIEFEWSDTMWSGYHDKVRDASLDLDHDDFSPDSVRTTVLKRMIKAMQPKRVVDFGANAGMNSTLAAQTGAEVLACELDETAASKCYRNFRNSPADMRMKVALEGFDFLRGNIPDLAMAPALTHHLFFTHNYDFEVIARILAHSTTANLITEYMPNGLGVGKPHMQPLPANYALEVFLEELGKYFKTVEVMEYKGYDHRKLVLATGRF